jgi:hypothetical protein
VDTVTEREPEAHDEDEQWRSIVDNYGDRPELPGTDLTSEPSPPAVAGPVADLAPELDDDRFVPPDPPPVPIPERPRLAAWLGVLIAPLLLLVSAAARIHLPGLVGFGLVAWFVAGFGYLVATMPRGPRDPGDDGARL